MYFAGYFLKLRRSGYQCGAENRKRWIDPRFKDQGSKFPGISCAFPQRRSFAGPMIGKAVSSSAEIFLPQKFSRFSKRNAARSCLRSAPDLHFRATGSILRVHRNRVNPPFPAKENGGRAEETQYRLPERKRAPNRTAEKCASSIGSASSEFSFRLFSGNRSASAMCSIQFDTAEPRLLRPENHAIHRRH